MSNKLAQLDIKPIHNGLWSFPSIQLPAIVCVDILHNILLGVQKYLMEWVQGFLGRYKRLAVFDEI